jgi:hypothetical protein
MASHSQQGSPPAAIATAGPAACEAWDRFAGEKCSPSTRAVYQSTVRRFLRWIEPQGIGLAQVTGPAVERFLASLSVPPTTRIQYRSSLRRFFNALVVRGVVTSNPADQAGIGDEVPPAEGLPSLAELQAAIRELDPAGMAGDTEMLDAGVVLLGGLYFGTGKIMPISRYTRVPPRRVAEFAERLRANGVWTADGKTAARWADEEGGGVALLLDILVATGMVEFRERRVYANEPEGSGGE